MAAQPHLKRITEARETLSREAARELMQQILAGQLSDLELSALLGALAARGETAAEIAGFVDVMRTAATPLPLTDAERGLLVDTCGTGGDASGTFNISTAAALVAAATSKITAFNIMVAKHGNRAVTSQSGSADVLEALGIPVNLSPSQAAEALRRHHFAFLHAPSLHPAMKAVMPVRRALGIRTVFNILGPLTNPAGARAQVMGVYSERLVVPVAQAMELLGLRHAFVVHGATAPDANGKGMDEASICGATQIAEVRTASSTAVAFLQLTPDEVGLLCEPVASLRGGDASTNAAILRSIFSGETGPRRSVVLLNAALVLISAGIVPAASTDLISSIQAGVRLAAQAIDSGAVSELIAELSSSPLTEP